MDVTKYMYLNRCLNFIVVSTLAVFGVTNTSHASTNLVEYEYTSPTYLFGHQHISNTYFSTPDAACVAGEKEYTLSNTLIKYTFDGLVSAYNGPYNGKTCGYTITHTDLHTGNVTDTNTEANRLTVARLCPTGFLLLKFIEPM